MCNKMTRKSGNASLEGNRAMLPKAQCSAVQREGSFACFYFWTSSPESSFQMARFLKHQSRNLPCVRPFILGEKTSVCRCVSRRDW